MSNRWRLRAAGDLIARRRWLPAVVWGAAILAVSSFPRLGLEHRGFPGCDKVMHFIEYFVLGVGLRYWSGDGRLFFVAGGVGFAAFDEFHQRFVPGRQASPWDLVADVAGIVVGFLLYGLFMKKENDG
jgi:VanZ family protein